MAHVKLRIQSKGLLLTAIHCSIYNIRSFIRKLSLGVPTQPVRGSIDAKCELEIKASKADSGSRI